jgi:excisionase family DNA binding protein
VVILDLHSCRVLKKRTNKMSRPFSTNHDPQEGSLLRSGNTQEAADTLKVSRPYLVNLHDTHALPSRTVGVQRRVKIKDLLGYQAREKAARIRALEELAAEGQRLNLGE